MKITPQTAAQWRKDGQFVEWQGHRIFVRTGGDKVAPPLLLLHGFPTSSLDWLPMWADLTARYRVVAFDFLGFGYSDKPKQHRYDVMEQTDLAAHLAETLFGEDFHILVHDYGVSPGQELLARTGEGSMAHRVLSGAFLNGGLIPAHHRPLRIQKLLVGPFGGLVVRLLNRKRFIKNFSKIFGADTPPSAAELDAYWSVICADGGNQIQHKLLHYLADRRVHAARWEATLKDPPCPMALINGTQDPISGGHLVDAVAEMNPEIPAWRLDHLGHYPQTEGAVDVMAAYAEFRAGLS